MQTDQLTAEEALALEKLIDRVGFATIAGALAILSLEKSQHIYTNWQDKALADRFDNASALFTRIENVCRRDQV